MSSADIQLQDALRRITVVLEFLERIRKGGDDETVSNGVEDLPTVSKLMADVRADIDVAIGDFVAAVESVSSAMVAAVSAAAVSEAARDSSIIEAGNYATEALGRAAVADGQAFRVQGSGDIAVTEYRRVNSGSSTPIAVYPSLGAVNNAKVMDIANGSQRVDDFTDLTRAVIQQTLGGSLTPFGRVQRVGGGLEVDCTTASRYFVLSRDFICRNGVEQEITLKGSEIRIDAGTISIGIAVGLSGGARRMYMYGSGGLVSSVLDAETVTTIAAASASRAFVNGSTIAITLRRFMDGSGQIVITTPSGAQQIFAVAGIPVGPVWLTHRGDGFVYYSTMTSEILPALAVRRLAESATKELDTGNRASLVAIEEIIRPQLRTDPVGFTAAPLGGRIIERLDGSFTSDIDFMSKIPFDPALATKLYCRNDTGNDANAGTATSPLKSLRQLLHGRTGNVIAYVRPGVYADADSFGDANPLCNLVLLPWEGDGRIISSLHTAGLVWTLSPGKANTWETTVASVGTIVDDMFLDAWGRATRLVAAPTADAVEDLPNSYFRDGTNLKVHTFNGRQPDGQFRVFKDARNSLYGLLGGFALYKGVDFEGGSRPMQQACLDLVATNTVYLDDCGFGYAGGSSGSNGFNTNGATLSFLKRCWAYSSRYDGLNYHGFTLGEAISAGPQANEIECRATNNGHDSGGTHNSSTMHDGGRLRRIGCNYEGSLNRQVHDVNDSQSANWGVVAKSPRGPENPINFVAGVNDADLTKMWLYKTRSQGALFDYATYASAQIRTYGVTDSGLILPGSNVLPYTP